MNHTDIAQCINLGNFYDLMIKNLLQHNKFPARFLNESVSRRKNETSVCFNLPALPEISTVICPLIYVNVACWVGSD